MPANNPDKEAILFLKHLQDSGISEIYLNRLESQMNVENQNQNSARAEKSHDLRNQMLELKQKVSLCKLCKELSETRKNTVFGSGNLKANLLFVGEAPGADEDEQGLPFVGRAGQLLTKIIESIGLTRNQVFIANVLKCRPPQNRQPLPDEIVNCSPFLAAQIDGIKPKIICALGTFAAQTLLKTDTPISSLRGKFYPYQNSKLICTFHPAYLLRNPDEKRKVWEDMKMIKRELDLIQS